MDSYTKIFFYIEAGFILLNFFYCNLVSFNSRYQNNLLIINFISYSFLFFTIFYMGCRPISDEFTDMPVYNYIYNETIQNGIDKVVMGKDLLFSSYMYVSSLFFSSEQFFFLTSLLYIMPLYLVSRRLFKNKWHYSLLLFLTSLFFWNYGTNTIRSGLAASVFLLAFSSRTKFSKLGIFFISFGIHASMAMPILVFFCASILKNTKVVLTIWFVSFINSLMFGDFLQRLLSPFIKDDRNHYLINTVAFRWDFIIYSLIPIIVGCFFIFVKKFNDNIYRFIYNFYVLSNSIWVLVIYANFSDRFAYLSWFMMPLVIIYPFLKSENMLCKNKKIAWVIFISFSFTFFMNVMRG